jgi:hypothetical protein
MFEIFLAFAAENLVKNCPIVEELLLNRLPTVKITHGIRDKLKQYYFCQLEIILKSNPVIMYSSKLCTEVLAPRGMMSTKISPSLTQK